MIDLDDNLIIVWWGGGGVAALVQRGFAAKISKLREPIEREKPPTSLGLFPFEWIDIIERNVCMGNGGIQFHMYLYAEN